MKIVILDGYCENPGDLSWDVLRALGELTVYDRTDDTDVAQIVQRIGDAEIIVINKTPITRQVIDACPSLRFITIMATGYNVVDCAYAAQKGIAVSNVPAYGTAAVAQFAIALLLEICMHVGDHAEAVQEGRWAACADFCFWDTPLIELAGLTFGVLGCGRIGCAGQGSRPRSGCTSSATAGTSIRSSPESGSHLTSCLRVRTCSRCIARLRWKRAASSTERPLRR